MCTRREGNCIHFYGMDQEPRVLLGYRKEQHKYPNITTAEDPSGSTQRALLGEADLPPSRRKTKALGHTRHPPAELRGWSIPLETIRLPNNRAAASVWKGGRRSRRGERDSLDIYPILIFVLSVPRYQHCSKWLLRWLPAATTESVHLLAFSLIHLKHSSSF